MLISVYRAYALMRIVGVIVLVEQGIILGIGLFWDASVHTIFFTDSDALLDTYSLFSRWFTSSIVFFEPHSFVRLLHYSHDILVKDDCLNFFDLPQPQSAIDLSLRLLHVNVSKTRILSLNSFFQESSMTDCGFFLSWNRLVSLWNRKVTVLFLLQFLLKEASLVL